MRRLNSLVLCVAVFACGGNDSPSGASTSTDLSGTWDATYTVPGLSIGAVFQLSQTNSAVTGTYVVSGGAPTGNVTGTVSGDQITFRFDQNQPCPGTFNGTGTISNGGRRITGSYSGSDCSGSLAPTFVADKR
jgi:hypothetical protein